MNLIKKEYELNCLSPVHIGDGTALKAFEYIYDPENQQVIFVQEAAWIAFLQKRDLIDAFVGYINKMAGSLSQRGPFKGKYIWDWLCYKGISKKEIRSLALRMAKVSANELSSKGHLNDVQTQLSLADGHPYIPGSSLKGSLRTAVIRHLLRKNPKLAQYYWQQISDLDLRNRRELNSIGRTTQRLESELLHKLNFCKGDNATKSVMKGIAISDALAEKKDTLILQKIDISTHAGRLGNNEKKLPLYRECIPPQEKLHFSITADFSILKEIGFQSLDEILSCWHEMTQDVLKLQKNSLGRSYSRLFQEIPLADVCLGGGSGLLFKSIIHSLAPDEEQARRFIAKMLDAQFQKFNRIRRMTEPAHNHVKLDSTISPRTVKIARQGSQNWLLGLCHIKEM